MDDSSKLDRVPQKTGKKQPNSGSFTKGDPRRCAKPPGRTPLPPDVKEAYTEMHPRALSRLRELLESDSEKIALGAIVVVIERVEGKAPQPLSVSGSLANPLAGVALEQLLQLLEMTNGQTQKRE